MSLYRRGGIWWIDFYRNGIRHQQSARTANRREAEKVEAKVKADITRHEFGIDNFDSKLTYGAIAAQFAASGSVRPFHLYHLKILLPYFAETPVQRLSKSMAENFRQYRHSQNTITDATVNRDLATLKRTLNWAIDENLIPANPLTRLKLVPERRIRRIVLSLEEEQKLLAAARGHLRDMVLVALDTGMRRGELTQQRVEDIDWERKLLYVSRSKTRQGELRELPMTARVEEVLLKNRKNAGFVFTYRGKPVRDIKRSWRNALARAGIRRIRLHDLRHTFATRLAEAGVHERVAMELTGHSTGARVHSMYVHIATAARREAIRKLEQWISEQQKQSQPKENTDARTENTGAESACPKV